MNNTNSVQLLGFYGGDKRVCLSAWQSTTDELGIRLPEAVEDRVDLIFGHLAAQKKKTPYELLEMLAREGHGTPFEKVIVDFQVRADLASHIHALKHRISQINAESARYKEFSQDKFYLPDDWGAIPMTQKAFETLDASPNPVVRYFGESGMSWKRVLKRYAEAGFALYHAALEDLTIDLGRKRAKESARYFLGYTTQLNFDWQMNWRSFVNIQHLRNDAHAQREIHQLANTMLYLVKTIPGNPFEGCIKAFNLQVDLDWVLPDVLESTPAVI